ncbi:sulfatase-like hydrolase/transferase [Halorussus halophilus]|uniref:sulfatase-like hydrolase/transferase n=1 Tax=Halorussus halophilus TaxID=2650975 RepID=UPI0013012D49|nr:sulfatase-like hydrolase/transferase [Halorussus halophilus]
MTRNVVLLCLDTVRKDYFDQFAPRLQRLADVTFTQCRAVSAWSTPSHASMLTGDLPSDHGVHTHALDFERLDRDDTLLGDLEAHRSFGVSANVYAGSAFGFDALFDEFRDVSRYHRFPDALDAETFVDDHGGNGVETYTELLKTVAKDDRPLRSLANVALFRGNDLVRHGPLGDAPELFDDGTAVVRRELLKRVESEENADGTEEPFFCFANLMDAHEPHRTIRGYDETLHSVPNDWTSETFDNGDVIQNSGEYATDLENYRDLYGASIDYLDRVVAGTIESIQERTSRETTFVITADHGENLGTEADESLFGHLASLSEGVLHVPLLLVNPPDGYDETITEYASHLSLRELLRGLAAGETPDVTEDRITAEVVGLTPNNDSLADSDEAYWDRLLRCGYEGDEKVVWDSLDERTTYELDRERPCWQAELSGDSSVPDWATARFETDAQTAKERAKETDVDRDVSDDVERRLAELGYK